MKIVTFGELLMRLSPPRHQRFAQMDNLTVNYGGAEANTAIMLAQLGHEVEFVSMLPDTDIGKSALREVSKWGVKTSHVKSIGQKMGLYFMEEGVSVRGGNIIYDRKGSSFCDVDATTFDWDKILDGADWFHWTGITPGVSVGAAIACAEAVKAANDKGITVSCDLNYRSKLWKYGVDPKEIMPELISGCHVVLANEEDVSKYLGLTPKADQYQSKHVFGDRSYEFVSKSIIDIYPQVYQVISTLRQTINASQNLWSGVVYDGEKFIEGPTFEIGNIVDRVGGGDSFMGAYIHGIFRFNDEEKALAFALAASSLKLTVRGDYNIASEAEILNFLNHEGVGRINR